MPTHEPEIAEILHVERIRQEFKDYTANSNESYKAEFERYPDEDYRRDTIIFYGGLALIFLIVLVAVIALVR